MLLLVLILVLLAFGLLLIALVTGSAAWAWISVAVSVGAAAVLLLDWAQRRSAAKSGGGDAGPVGSEIDPPTTAFPVIRAPEPATEVFPAVRTPATPDSASDSDSAAEPDAELTVTGPAVPAATAAPSGSPEQPSGAGSDEAPESQDLSRKVTESDDDHPKEESSPTQVDDEGADVPAAADKAVVAPGPVNRPAEKPGDPSEVEATTVIRPVGRKAGASGDDPSPSSEAAASADSSAGSGRGADPPSTSGDAERTQTISAVRGAGGEPGEERPDAAAATTVAALSDEVRVVDEEPRYHLAGCRLLAGSETIPLPAKEAVEFGFTPCAVCTPVRVLAGRNRAASSS